MTREELLNKASSALASASASNFKRIYKCNAYCVNPTSGEHILNTL